ncbi:MAG: hypothetical protein AB1611_15790 [bacterium]
MLIVGIEKWGKKSYDEDALCIIHRTDKYTVRADRQSGREPQRPDFSPPGWQFAANPLACQVL